MNALLQHNIWQEAGYDRFVESLREYFHITEVHVIPFTSDFGIPLPEDYKPDLVFGSNRFVDICREKGYSVYRSFTPETSYSAPKINLNDDGKIYNFKKLRTVPSDGWPLFLKPLREKFFTGLVVNNVEDLDKIQLTTSLVKDPDEEFIFAFPPKKIGLEIRFFVICNIVITASVYKENGIPKQYQIDPSHEACLTLKKFMLMSDPIDFAYVADMGYTDKGWKVIEFNNINSAGIYKCDTDALAKAFSVLM